jgi:hypothetical protein
MEASVVDQMKAAIQRATAHGQKIAMFHFQVLTNACAQRSHPIACGFLGRPGTTEHKLNTGCLMVLLVPVVLFLLSLLGALVRGRP